MHVSLLRRCRLFPCVFFNSNKIKHSFISASFRCLASCQISFICSPWNVRKQCVMDMEQADPTTMTASSQSTIKEVSEHDEEIDNKTSECGKRKSEEPLENEGQGRGKRRRGERGKKQRPGERYIPPPQKRNPGVSFSQEHFDETSYFFEGGLRKVVPYYYDFKTYCKGRWIGKSLLEVFQSEFRSESIEYYQRAAKEGRIRLNQSPVEDLNIILRNNDHMCNTVHRHEPPVVGRPLEILVDDGEVLVVDKPASIPVHPCGRFRHNTVIFILGKERGVAELHTVHRLDRLTSGVLLFARDLDTSKRLDQLVRDRQLVKEYVCRVEGEFPESEVICEEPILVVSFKIGLCRVHPNGKDCRTVFQRLSFNGQSSVVRCLPLTGRTHQIRVHLQYLGHPILNDPIYGSSAWGPNRGKGGRVDQTDEELLQALVEEHRAKESLHMLDMPDGEIKAISKSKQGKGNSGDSQCTELCKDDSKSDAAMAESSRSGGKTTSEFAKECEELSKSKICEEKDASGDSQQSTCCDTTSDTVASSNFRNNSQNTQSDANVTSEFAKEFEELSKSKTCKEKDASGDSQQSASCDANVASSNFSNNAQNDNTQNDNTQSDGIANLKSGGAQPYDTSVASSNGQNDNTQSHNTQSHNTQSHNTQSDGTAHLKSGGAQPTTSNGDDKNNASKDPLCSECKMVRPDPTEKELVMYLHALRYKGPGFEYSTQLPDWAKEDWTEDN